MSAARRATSATDDVVAISVRKVVSTPAGRDGRRDAPDVATMLRRRWEGSQPIDEWGLDPELVDLLDPLLAARWRIDVVGARRLPADGPAVVVFNRRVGVSEMFVCSRGLRQATGRFIRPVGAPDIAPIGPALRRFGAVQSHPDEVAGLLKAGELVAVPLDRELWHGDRAGGAPLGHLTAAVLVGVPVVPVAVVGSELRRRWRVFVGEPLAVPVRRGPLAVAELSDVTRRRVQQLLDQARSGPVGPRRDRGEAGGL